MDDEKKNYFPEASETPISSRPIKQFGTWHLWDFRVIFPKTSAIIKRLRIGERDVAQYPGGAQFKSNLPQVMSTKIMRMANNGGAEDPRGFLGVFPIKSRVAVSVNQIFTRARSGAKVESTYLRRKYLIIVQWHFTDSVLCCVFYGFHNKEAN